MKHTGLFVLFILAQHLLFAQSTWTVLNSNTNYDLNDVYFTSELTGVAIGENGRVVSTTDGGDNWTEANAVPGCNLNRVHFATADSGWIASTCGIHITTDGGASWTLQSAGNGEVINDVFFFNSSLGWAVGDKMTLMRTTDGGANWIIDTLSSQVANNPLLAVHFRTATDGWIGGGEKLHYTTDGGQTWNLGSSLLIDWVYAMDFGNEYAGAAGGMIGSVTNTIDGGNSWDFNGSITPNQQYVYGISYSSADSVYCVGADGVILFSNTAGTNWTQQTSGVTETLRGVHFPSSDVGFAVGEFGRIIRLGAPAFLQEETGFGEFYSVYPNPAKSSTNIVLCGTCNDPILSITLTDALGKEAAIPTPFTRQKDDWIQLDLNAFAKGTYVMRITTTTSTQSGLLIITD